MLLLGVIILFMFTIYFLYYYDYEFLLTYHIVIFYIMLATIFIIMFYYLYKLYKKDKVYALKVLSYFIGFSLLCILLWATKIYLTIICWIDYMYHALIRAYEDICFCIFFNSPKHSNLTVTAELCDMGRGLKLLFFDIIAFIIDIICYIGENCLSTDFYVCWI